MLGVTRAMVHRYITRGRLAARMVGGVWIISVTDVEAFEKNPVGRPRKENNNLDNNLGGNASLGLAHDTDDVTNAPRPVGRGVSD